MNEWETIKAVVRRVEAQFKEEGFIDPIAYIKICDDDHWSVDVQDAYGVERGAESGKGFDELAAYLVELKGEK
jgi:hypothetical protein